MTPARSVAKNKIYFVFYYRRAVAYTLVYAPAVSGWALYINIYTRNSQTRFIGHILPEFTKKSTACILTIVKLNLKLFQK